MWKLTVTLAIWATVCLYAKAAKIPFNGLIINTDGGQVQGTEERTADTDLRYYSWKGIPYAAPPVGNLRFADPVPHPGWTGVRDASEHGSTCPSSSGGNEDCLFLNVYSANIIDRRPVMVWIHGGSFNGGSGNTGNFPPDLYVAEDVIFVTINYRLGILGFLSTADRHAPGNYAMKDMIMALRWIQNNILNFGGDPDNVTIFGESAGGSAVHMLTLSPMSRGLFHKAITQSGTALTSWTIQFNPMNAADRLATRLGLTYSSTEDLVAQLRNLPAEELVAEQPDMFDLPIARGIASTLTYVPTIDPEDYDGDKFLPRHPREIMESGDFMDIPLIIGYTSDEALYVIAEQLLDPTVAPTINANRNLVVPTTMWDVDPNSAEGHAITDAFFDFYMHGEDLSPTNRYEWSQFNSDVHFNWGVDQCVRLHARQSNPVYYYVFSYDGAFNNMKHQWQLTPFPGAMHADDLGYLFNGNDNPDVAPTNHAFMVRRRFVKLWVDFAKYGNPTPETDSLVITTNWPRVEGNMEYLDIGHNLVAGTQLYGDRMRLWNDLMASYVN